MPTVLLDIHDELLTRCLAGAGGFSIRAASVACSRLCAVSNKLKQLPVFSSALSTRRSLRHAITDAAERALTGTFERCSTDAACDDADNDSPEALSRVLHDHEALFWMQQQVTTRSHCVQDVVVVGCTCSGLMGVGPDNQPMEVDPHRATDFAKKAAAVHKQQGLPPLPTKGVSVLLGKLPPGSVARAFAHEDQPDQDHLDQQDQQGQQDTEGEEALEKTIEWSCWPLLNEALMRTDIQEAATDYWGSRTPSAAAALACQQAGSEFHWSKGRGGTGTQGHQAGGQTGWASASVAAAAGCGIDPDATRAAPEQSYTGEWRATAAGTSVSKQVFDSPVLCLMFYDASLQTCSQEDEGVMHGACTLGDELGVTVVGGVASGSGDLFYSSGAQGSRVHQDPPRSPKVVGLLLHSTSVSYDAKHAAVTSKPAAAAAAEECSITSDNPKPAAAAAAAAACLHDQAASQVASKAALVGGEVSSDGPWVLYHKSALQADAFGSAGFGPLERDHDNGAPDWLSPWEDQFTDVKAKILGDPSYPGALNEHVYVALVIESCTVGHCRANVAPLAQQGHALEQLQMALSRDLKDPKIDDPHLALWSTSSPARFTGLEKQMVIGGVVCCLAVDIGLFLERRSALKVILCFPYMHLHELKRLCKETANPGAITLCAQALRRTGATAAAMMRYGVRELLPAIGQPQIPPAVAAAVTKNAGPRSGDAAQPDQAAAVEGSSTVSYAGGEAGSTCALGPLQDCYNTLALTAWEAGARSGPSGLCVCSSVSRGQSLMCDPQHPESYGDLTEAGIVDDVCGRRVPFVGVCVDGELGPDLKNSCVGRSLPRCCSWPWQRWRVTPPEMASNTSMIAGWGCQPEWYD